MFTVVLVPVVDSAWFALYSVVLLLMSTSMCMCSVTAKGERRTWSNARGEGSLFSVDLLDKNGTQIRGTFFKEGVDKFYDVIHKDCVYYFSNGRLKAANKAFTSIANDYEISFDASATVVYVRCWGVRAMLGLFSLSLHYV